MGPWATPDQVWLGALVFARVGALLMLVPGVGDQAVPARVRLSLALLVAMALTPVVGPGLPPLPASVGTMAAWTIRETVIGLMLGALMRTFLAALAVAGEIVSLQTTLSFAQTANPMQAQPGTTLATFLGLMGVILVFSTGLHHLFFAGLVRSYALFAPHKALMLRDFASLALRTTADAFAMGVQLSAPLMVFSLVFNLAAGLIGRTMPQFQIFFAATPLTVLLGLSIFALTLGAVGMAWVDRYEATLRVFAGT